jgi:hypothetical protein
MAQRRAAKHAMKMGVLSDGALFTAMNMAWTGNAPATMVAPLVPSPSAFISEVLAMKIANHLASSALSFAMLIATAFLPASAQSGPSPQEQMACRGDASKFCAEHIGKPPQMNACLRENKAKLSEGCRKVVESRGG